MNILAEIPLPLRDLNKHFPRSWKPDKNENYRVIQNFYPPSPGKMVCTWNKSMFIPATTFSLTIICQMVSHVTHLFKSYSVFSNSTFVLKWPEIMFILPIYHHVCTIKRELNKSRSKPDPI